MFSDFSLLEQFVSVSPWLAVDQVIQQWAPVEGATLEQHWYIFPPPNWQQNGDKKKDVECHRGLVWVSNYLVGASTRALSLRKYFLQVIFLFFWPDVVMLESIF